MRWLAEHSGVPASRKLLTRPKETSWLTDSLKAWFGLDLAAMAALSGLNATAAAGALRYFCISSDRAFENISPYPWRRL